MSWTVSSDSIPHGQKQAFIYMLVNGMEIEDFENDDFFARYHVDLYNQHRFSGLSTGMYLISCTKIKSFMNMLRKHENEQFRVTVMFNCLDNDSPYTCGKFLFMVSRKEMLDMYQEMEKKGGKQSGQEG